MQCQLTCWLVVWVFVATRKVKCFKSACTDYSLTYYASYIILNACFAQMYCIDIYIIKQQCYSFPKYDITVNSKCKCMYIIKLK